MEKKYIFEVIVQRVPIEGIKKKFIKKVLQNETYRAMCVMLADAYGIKPHDVLVSPEYAHGNVSFGFIGTKKECKEQEAALRHSFGLPGTQAIKNQIQRLLKKKPSDNAAKKLSNFEKVCAYLSFINIIITHEIRQVQ